MRTGSRHGRHGARQGSTRARLRAARPRTLAVSLLPGLAALLTFCASAGTASANRSHGPEYSLKVIEGETTLPEYEQIAQTSGSVEPQAQVAVSIVRGGVTVYRDVQSEGSAWLSQVPQVGDVVTLESPVGTTIASVVYDGLPSIDATVCAGSTNFSGENSSGDTVEGFYLTEALETNPYGHVVGVRRTAFGEAQVKSLTGTTFGGNFLQPLSLGETVGAVESLKTPLANEGTYTYTSEFERPVGNCPVPPAPYVPPAPPVLQGTLLALAHTTILALLQHGWHDRVTINQAGTVTQDLYLQDGTLPAYAASAKGKRSHRPKTPPALLLARGVVSAKSAGTIGVTLKLTAHGRARLKASKSARVVLVTTLRTASGARLNLPRHTILLHR